MKEVIAHAIATSVSFAIGLGLGKLFFTALGHVMVGKVRDK